jgi:hypothetical protein
MEIKFRPPSGAAAHRLKDHVVVRFAMSLRDAHGHDDVT